MVVYLNRDYTYRGYLLDSAWVIASYFEYQAESDSTVFRFEEQCCLVVTEIDYTTAAASESIARSRSFELVQFTYSTV